MRICLSVSNKKARQDLLDGGVRSDFSITIVLSVPIIDIVSSWFLMLFVVITLADCHCYLPGFRVGTVCHHSEPHQLIIGAILSCPE